MPLANSLKSWLYPIYRNYFSRVYLYEGVLKNDKGVLRCLFVDNDAFYLEVLQKLFGQSPKLVRTFRYWVPGLKRLLVSPDINADICIANVAVRHAPLFHDSATFIMQTRVRQTLDMASAPDKNKRYRDARKRIEKKIRKSDLTHRISHSVDDFDHFYHRMYKPLIRKFGHTAMDMSYEDLKSIFENGLLILVLYNGEPVSGLICLETKDLIVSYRLGLLDANQAYLDMGAQSACYYFFFEYASHHGYQKIDFMRSLPFLNDGVYMHKRLLGARTETFEDATTWAYLFNLGSSETLARVIEVIPMISHSAKGLQGVVTIPDEDVLTSIRQKELFQQYGAPGLTGLHIVREKGGAEQIVF